MNYKPSSAEAFSSIEYIMRDVEWGWLIRYMHSTGASAFFIVIYLHMFRALLYGSHRKPRELLWIFGCLIFLLLMAEAFMGYVLPWGNMSYWGAQVIVSIFSSVPIVGQSLVEWIRGDYYIADATLNRFFALHVAALPLALIFLVIAHLMALHEVGSNNPDGIEIKKHKDANGHPLDGIPFHPYYTVKDTVGIAAFLLVFCAVIFFAPTFGGLFLEEPNFQPADPLQTPPHIAPVWYFTPYYAMLRAVPSFAGTQIWGVLVLGAAVRRAVLPAVAGSLAGELDPLSGADLQGDAGHLRRIVHRPGGLRFETAVGDLPDAGAGMHGSVFCFLFADALVHEVRKREAGAGKGHGTCLKPRF